MNARLYHGFGRKGVPDPVLSGAFEHAGTASARAAGNNATSEADGDLRFDVEEALRWAPNVPSTRLSVLVTDGIVTLAGTVPTPASRTAALDAVRHVHGVHTVIDDIVVSSEEPCSSEQSIARAAQLLILNNSPAPDVRITVCGSVITLTGSVDQPAQRAAIAHTLRAMDGVTWVQNDLTVRGNPPAGASVTPCVGARRSPSPP